MVALVLLLGQLGNDVVGEGGHLDLADFAEDATLLAGHKVQLGDCRAQDCIDGTKQTLYGALRSTPSSSTPGMSPPNSVGGEDVREIPAP